MCEVFIYSFNQQVVIDHLYRLDSVLGPENLSVNKMEKFSAFLNGACSQAGNITKNKQKNK